MAAAREQNLTDSANRDDFSRKMYLGLRGKKKLRSGDYEDTPEERAALDRQRLQKELALQAYDSSSEDELIEQEDDIDDKDSVRSKSTKHRKRNKKDTKKHKKKKKLKRKKHGSSSRKKKRKRDKQDASETDTSTNASDYSKSEEDTDSACSTETDDKYSSSRSKRKRFQSSRNSKSSKRKQKWGRSESDDNKNIRTELDEKDLDTTIAKGSQFHKTEELVEFIPATGYRGSKQGYVFKKDTLGIGYYLDRYKRKVIGCGRPTS